MPIVSPAHSTTETPKSRPRKKLVELICQSGQSEESALSWIRAPRQDRKRPVNLLRQHHARQFVRIRHGTQRNLLLHAFPQRLRESVRIPTNKNNLACSPVSLFTEPFRKGPGIKRLSGRVKQHHCCRAFSLKSPDRRFSVAYFGDFDRARPRDALDIVPQNGIHLRSPRPSEHQQPDLHYHRTSPPSCVLCAPKDLNSHKVPSRTDFFPLAAGLSTGR